MKRERNHGVYVCAYIHTMEHYSAIEKNEILPLVTTWMDFKVIYYVN